MDDLEKYKRQMTARICQLLERLGSGETTESHIAFEIVSSLYDASEWGLDHKDLSDMYPISSWQEDTITVPRAIAHRFYLGWTKYQKSNGALKLGEAFALEGGGQGRSPVRKINKTIDEEKRRANAVVEKAIRAEMNEEPFKLLAAYYEVAEDESERTGKRVSPSAVKNAYQEHGLKTLETVRQKLREVSGPTS